MRLHPALKAQLGPSEGRPAGQVVLACAPLPPHRASHTREGRTMGAPRSRARVQNWAPPLANSESSTSSQDDEKQMERIVLNSWNPQD